METGELFTLTRKCRVCGNEHLAPIVNLGEHALTGRFPAKKDPDPPHGLLQLVRCDTEAKPDACGLVQLQHQFNQWEMFGSSYGYRSSVTTTMVQHLRGKVENLLSLVSLQAGDTVLDIGCNDGTLLDCYRHIHGVNAVGIDPSSGQFAAVFPPHAQLLVDFFSAKRVRELIGDKKIKIITSIAMFYDVDNPLGFMQDIRSLLADDGVWEMEQSYLPDVVENMTYDTICHEHATYYRLEQIAWLAERADLTIIDAEMNNVNGGSFRVVLAPKNTPYRVNRNGIQALKRRERDYTDPATYAKFAADVADHRRIVRSFFERNAKKKIFGLGASTKGNVLLQYCGITKKQMPYILERYPQKFGLTTPGTRIPIISEVKGRALQPDYLFVLPWHFRDEIFAREQEFLDKGGLLVFPLPRFEVVGKGGQVVQRLEML
ncbi:MAG: class I SAM-dependent methyltransferase [Alphaproteobacteria bacterium]